MSSNTVRLAALAVAMFAAIPGARAQANREDRAAKDDVRAEARTLHDEGLRRFNAGEYELAIAPFKRAYSLAPTPALLFNIAQALRLAGPEHCAEALQYYKDYLRVLPDTPNRAMVEDSERELGACGPTVQPERSTPAPPTRPAPNPTREPDRPHRWIPLTLAGAGVALGAAGAILYFGARSDYDQFTSSCAAGTCLPSVWEGARTRERVGLTLLIAGGVGAAAGVTWWILGRKESPRAAWISPTVGGLAAGGTF